MQVLIKEQEEIRVKRKIPWVRIVLLIVPLAFTVFFYLICGNREFCNAASRVFSYPVRNFMGKISTSVLGDSYTSLSLAEILYTLAVLLALAIIIGTIVLAIRRKGHRAATVLKGTVTFITIVAYIWCLFCWLWNIEYHTTTFSEKSGLESVGVYIDDLIDATAYFAYLANEYSTKVQRDEEGHFAVPLEECFSLEGLYNERMLEEFPCLADKQNYQPKGMKYSKIFSRIGFTGVYFPLSGESTVNVDVPGCYIPSTVAHEMAHQLGVAPEAEANFVSVASCLLSGNDVYIYSGSLLGLSKLMNALYTVDYATWEQIYYSLNDFVRLDRADNSAYWAALESNTSKAADAVYDTFLKSNGQELGIKSYGACVDLIVAWLNNHRVS